MTSAPLSARTFVAKGPAPPQVKSSTRMPSSASLRVACRAVGFMIFMIASPLDGRSARRAENSVDIRTRFDHGDRVAPRRLREAESGSRPADRAASIERLLAEPVQVFELGVVE